jgi:hypothetical protein
MFSVITVVRVVRAVAGFVAAGFGPALFSATPPATAVAPANATIDEAIARGDFDGVKKFLDADA